MSSAIYSIVSALCGGALFVVHVVFLIVTLTSVRTGRPDAWFPFCVAAVIFILQSAIGSMTPLMLPRLVSIGYTSSSYMGMVGAVYMFGALMSGIAWMLVIIGLVKIASPPQEFSLNRPPGG